MSDDVNLGNVHLEDLLDEVARRLAFKVADEIREKKPNSMSWEAMRIRAILDQSLVYRTQEMMNAPDFESAYADSKLCPDEP